MFSLGFLCRKIDFENHVSDLRVEEENGIGAEIVAFKNGEEE